MSQSKDYAKVMDEQAERRFFDAPVSVEKRAEGDKKTTLFVIEGYAAKFNSRTDLGWFDEEILPGAFDDILNDDVRCLFNHSPNFVLARSNEGKGTLSLTIDATGLKYSYTTPNRTFAIDLQDAIESGDVTQSSFAFRASEVVWIEKEGENELRQIKKIERLYDVSPVTYPAYADTNVAKRNFEARESEKDTKENTSGSEQSGSMTVRQAQCKMYQY